MNTKYNMHRMAVGDRFFVDGTEQDRQRIASAIAASKARGDMPASFAFESRRDKSRHRIYFTRTA